MSNNIEKSPDITKPSHATSVSSNSAILPTVVVAAPTLDPAKSIDILANKKDDLEDLEDPEDPKDHKDPKDSKDVLKEIKEAKETKDAKVAKDRKALGSKEQKLLHRMFHGKEKEKDKDIDEGSIDKSRPGLSKLAPNPSYESDAGSSVSSHTDRSGRPPSPQAHFVLNDDGTHAHHLNHMGKKENNLMQIFHRERKGHHRHLPLFGHDNKHENPPNDKDDGGNDRANVKSSRSSALYRSPSEMSLTQKYGQCREVCGKGAFGIVRVAHKYQDHHEQLFAVKEFKKRDSESNRAYVKRLTSEFCISSTLHHTNIIRTLDLLPVSDSSEHYAEVMEYCSGGDVFAIVHEFGSLEREEANCFFKQLVNGVGYLHKMGVAHRDLKPENLLLAGDGCLKITDFGNGECFKMAWEPESAAVHASKGVCGSGPYIAPEEFTAEEFDPRCVDVWAVGVIYVALITGRHLWHIARPEEDELFRTYVEVCRNMSERAELQRQSKKVSPGKLYGIDVLDKLEEGPRQLIYGMLQPDPKKRLTIPEIQHDDFFQNIWTCHQPVEEDVKRIPAIRSTNGAAAQSKSVGVKA